ncbi:CDP-diacylglycerol--glycerol-3-phosphate 3-phosphatidyltransferase, partial [Escherichia coli]
LWRRIFWVGYAGSALFFVAVVLTLWSMLQYLSSERADLLDQ